MLRPLNSRLYLITLLFRSVASTFSATTDLKLLHVVFLDLTLVIINLAKGARHAFIVLEVVSPALALIGLDQSTIEQLTALEDLMAVLLDIQHVLLVKLEIILRVVVQIARLPYQARGHLVCDELLPTVKCG